MKTTKCFTMALTMVLHSRLRSWLTILGIVIGVASVISIVGIGTGLSQQVNSNLGQLEADIITISPGYSKAQSFGPPGRGGGTFGETSSSNQDPLTNKDIQTLKGISNIELINQQVSGSVDLTYLGEKGTVTLTGVNQKVYYEITNDEVSEGRLLQPSDSNVIIIGGRLASGYFEKEIKINQLLSIEGRSFRVVGILDDTSNSIIMPIDSAYEVLENKEKNEYDTIELKVKDVDKLNETEEEIVTKLMRSRHITNEDDRDFTVKTNAESDSLRQEMTSTLTTFLTAIASVSLLVGAVGIANTMFTAVLEKTKDIGIMKSIGARNEDILIIFILNAALIGLVGGLIGVAFGYLFSLVLTYVGLTSIIAVKTVFVTLGVSIAVGMISGFIPAVNASKLDPVIALRRD
ncbi:ABC transporter permease [Candidatus Woesearchaeota archaeon]|nr:ABC transporter permease [Nanoarchaeota archaeon]MCB9370379.1 ABC transporter permease [Candidatus Woesearchaeota archaeon]